MSGTRIGGLKVKAVIKARDPNHYVKMGALGGSNGKGPMYNGGFAEVDQYGNEVGRVRARIAGAKGGSISKRGPRWKTLGG